MRILRVGGEEEDLFLFLSVIGVDLFSLDFEEDLYISRDLAASSLRLFGLAGGRVSTAFVALYRTARL